MSTRHVTISATGIVSLTLALGSSMWVGCTNDTGSNNATGAHPVAIVGTIQFLADNVMNEFYVNGVGKLHDSIITGAAAPETLQLANPIDTSISSGKLVIAAKVTNTGFLGGLMMNVFTNVDTFTTDGSWKWMIDPPAGWEQPGYNDAGWYSVADVGPADSVPTMVRDSSCILSEPACPINPYLASGARYIWAPTTYYFRKTFTSAAACSTVAWAGADGPYEVWLDGDSVAADTAMITSRAIHLWLTQGSHTLALYAQCAAPLIDGTGMHTKFAMAKDSVAITPELDWVSGDTIGWDTADVKVTVIVSDTSWLVSAQNTAGWQQPSFTPGSGWYRTDVFTSDFWNTGGFPPSTMVPGVYIMTLPQTICFRKTVSVH